MEKKMTAVTSPFPILRHMLLILLLYLSTCTTAVVVQATPAYLLAERRGKKFTYEARSAKAASLEDFLTDESTSFLYAFTEEMNDFIRELFKKGAMNGLSDGEASAGFDNCIIPSPSPGTQQSYLTTSGCFKTLLHAGTAGDCTAVNPFCCVQYWRYPASLSDRLPSDQIDTRLIFWDGTNAVNGYYTNFSDQYRSRYPSCSTFSTWPEQPEDTDPDPVLSVDANGDWRYTRRSKPVLTYVEIQVIDPTEYEEKQFTLLEAVARKVWEAEKLPIRIPLTIVVADMLTLEGLFLLCLLIVYHCGYKKDAEEEEAWRTKMEDVQQRTTEVEKKMSAQRSGSFSRLASPSSLTRHNTLGAVPESMSRSANLNDARTQAPTSHFTTSSDPHANRKLGRRTMSQGSLSRHDSQRQLQSQASLATISNQRGEPPRRHASWVSQDPGANISFHPIDPNLSNARQMHSRSFENPFMRRQSFSF